MIGKGVMWVTVTGRKSGKSITTPTNYLGDGNTLWIISWRERTLQTSILDRLTATLCDSLTERTDGHTVLEQLEQANLFLVPLDDERRWYRYHHLFADLLRHRLRHTQPDSVPELHRRASWATNSKHVVLQRASAQRESL
jgi:ATP/maltotriose-dependent transcriptional regulator MalT